MSYTDLVLHVDTLGLRADAAVIGLGGLFFHITDSVAPTEAKYWAISAGTNPHSRSLDPAVVDYWRGDAPYFDPFHRELYALEAAAEEFSEFFRARQQQHPVRVWMWAAAIEGTILQSAFESIDLPLPWPYYDVWEGKTFCRASEVYAARAEFPTPQGPSPEEQMIRRAGAIQNAHRCFVRAFNTQEAAA